MKFAVEQRDRDELRDNAAQQVVAAFRSHGHELHSNGGEVNFVLNLTSAQKPRSTKRRSQSVFIISFLATDHLSGDFQSLLFTLLVRTMSNLLVVVTPRNGELGEHASPGEAYFTTPEGGFYHIPFEPDKVYELMLPVAGAHFAISNRMSADLPEPYWISSPVVEEIKRHGQELDKLGVLPMPFPLHDYLSPVDLRHVYKIYGITGMSYGNLSARETIPELGDSTFWMTGRGVNKGALSLVGRDILFVTGFDRRSCEVLVSVPADNDPRARVSVDAVEHELIYRTYPEVGAIVHVHAWIEGALSTTQNYPCGTIELAEEVVQLLAKTGTPARAVVGLKNHGLTITGPTLDEIFSRVRDKLLRQVPMMP
jgi:ribulose-5-phosphate 4-epimerase/fuculose-1-phosphate aldolase